MAATKTIGELPRLTLPSRQSLVPIEEGGVAQSATTAALGEAIGASVSLASSALMAAYDAATDGQTVTVSAGFNGKPESFTYDDDSTLTADGEFIVDAAGMGAGRWISSRTVYADYAEFDADVRSFTAGTRLDVASQQFVTADSGEDFTTTGGIKVVRALELAEKTTRDLTVHVSPSGSDTSNDGQTAGSPFLTLNKAESTLPVVTFDHQETVEMAAGTYNESFTPAADMPRSAILHPGQRVRRLRTAQSGSDLVGSIVYKGQGDTSIVETNPTDGYTYGLYVTFTEAAFQDFKIKPATTGATSALATIHRGAYGHFRNVNFAAGEGATSALSVIVESGATLEAVDCQMEGATSLDLLVYADCLGSVAGVSASTKVGKTQVSGTLGVSGDVEFTSEMLVSGGGHLFTQINGSLRPKFSGTSFTVDRGATATLSETDIEVPLTARGDIRLDSCNVTRAITADGCTVTLNGVTTVGLTDAYPLVRKNGGRFIIDATSEIRNNAGSPALIGQRGTVTTVTAASNNGVITLPGDTPEIDLQILTSGANRTGWTFAATPSGLFSGTPFGHGTRLRVHGLGFSLQILSGNGFVFPGGAIQITRNIPGGYSGFEAVYNADVGNVWCVTGVGLLY